MSSSKDQFFNRGCILMSKIQENGQTYIYILTKMQSKTLSFILLDSFLLTVLVNLGSEYSKE